VSTETDHEVAEVKGRFVCESSLKALEGNAVGQCADLMMGGGQARTCFDEVPTPLSRWRSYGYLVGVHGINYQISRFTL
jgi:hypothetical protein